MVPSRRMRLAICLVTAALAGCAARRPVAPPPPAAATPGSTLTRRDIVDAMAGVTPRVSECFDRRPRTGLFEVTMQVSTSGRVTNVHVRGPDAEENQCIGLAVAGATFPPFSGGPMTITYPFWLR